MSMRVSYAGTMPATLATSSVSFAATKPAVTTTIAPMTMPAAAAATTAAYRAPAVTMSAPSGLAAAPRVTYPVMGASAAVPVATSAYKVAAPVQAATVMTAPTVAPARVIAAPAAAAVKASPVVMTAAPPVAAAAAAPVPVSTLTRTVTAPAPAVTAPYGMTFPAQTPTAVMTTSGRTLKLPPGGVTTARAISTGFSTSVLAAPTVAVAAPTAPALQTVAMTAPATTLGASTRYVMPAGTQVQAARTITRDEMLATGRISVEASPAPTKMVREVYSSSVVPATPAVVAAPTMVSAAPAPVLVAATPAVVKAAPQTVVAETVMVEPAVMETGAMVVEASAPIEAEQLAAEPEPAAAPAPAPTETAAPTLIEDIKNDGFFSGIGHWMHDKILGPTEDFRIKLGAVFPDFACETSKGNFTFHEYLGSDPSWTILFSYSKDFNPVCTTELGECFRLVDHFAQIGVKLIGLSCDTIQDHIDWSKDVLASQGFEGDDLGFPLIADPKREIASLLGILDPMEADQQGAQFPGRALFIIGPDKTNRLTMLYPATTGRMIPEVLRVIYSLFLTQDFSLATPANWQEGDKVIVAPSVPTEVAAEKFENMEILELPSGKQYLRYVDCPQVMVTNPAPMPPPTKTPVPPMDFKIALGADFPNFFCDTTHGQFNFHDYLDDQELPAWTILFSHPKDFTPVCTTELGTCVEWAQVFMDKGVKLIGLSCDSVDDHLQWSQDVLAAKGFQGDNFNFPMIADPKREIAGSLGMLDPNEQDGAGLPMPARGLFVIGPDKKNKASILYPATTGRNFQEVLRIVDSIFLSSDGVVTTPANWQEGDRLCVHPQVAHEVAQERYANLEWAPVPSGYEYLRFVDYPMEQQMMPEQMDPGAYQQG